MIELHNVTKIYHTKHKKHTTALDGVSFALPDKGFVFIVGKSGCGKSTLLNMMGGCDKLTAGDIIVDGNSFSSFKVEDYDAFRNSYVGFVFQDFCLLERLTVRQNVALALQLQGIRDEVAIDDALKQVEMQDYADRLPDELSGGQKQRVAIARTIVKRPKLVLADEPTGNLDAKSTRNVLEMLRTLSRETLVVIVSHNRADAEEFADRIIELSDGKVVDDVSRNPDARDITFQECEIVIQKGVVFTETQLEEINKRTTAGNVTFRQQSTRFLPTAATATEEPAPVAKIPRKSPSRRGRRILFGMFAKKRAVSMAVTVLSVVFIIAVMGICQFFTQFSPDTEIARVVAQSDSNKTFILQKAHTTGAINSTPVTSPMTNVTEKDLTAFRSTGYEGGIYPLYNVSLMTHTGGENLVWDIEGYTLPRDSVNYANFYSSSGLGVLVANRQFLAKIYGDEEGNLKVLSGTLDTPGDKIILTDYLADSILAYSPHFIAGGKDIYAIITNGDLHLAHFRVAGVIDTGYKERYADLIQKITDGSFSLKTDAERYEELLLELNSTLNIGYSFNPDFYESYSTDEEIPRSIYYGTMEIRCGDKVITNNSYSYRSDWLKPDEIMLNRAVYAQLMGINEEDVKDSEAVGTKLTLSRYNFVRFDEDAPDFTLQVTVAGLLDNVNGVGGFNCSPEIYAQLKLYGNAPYALYFDDLSKVMELYDKGSELTYVVRDPLVSALYTVAKASLVFTDVFNFIGFVLVALAAVMLAAFGAGSVRKNMYEIAVVRALGGRTRDLVLMFVLQMLFVSLVVCLLSIGAMALGANLCNAMLADGFVKLANNVFMRQLHVITFRWTTALLDAVAVLLLTALAAVVPMLALRRAKPREIIKAKE